MLTRDPLQLQLSPSAPTPGRMPAVMNPQPPATDESAPRPGTPIAQANPQILNPYTYGMNNPANNTDPTGHGCSAGLWSFCGIFTLTSSISYGGVSVPILLLAGIDTINCTYVGGNYF